MTAILPPLPRVMDGLLGPIPVRRARDLRAEDGTPVGGLWYEERREIAVRICATRATSWYHLFHEKAHADFDDYGVRFPTVELEERACDAVATARLRDLRASMAAMARRR